MREAIDGIPADAGINCSLLQLRSPSSGFACKRFRIFSVRWEPDYSGFLTVINIARKK
jgi:hypothetical protein